MELGCNKAYYGKDRRIYCTQDDELCGHQKYCDMSLKYKLTTAECTRRRKKNGKTRKTVSE